MVKREWRNRRRFERNGDGGKKIAMITAITGATRDHLYQQPLLLLFSTGNCQDPRISRRRPKKRSGSKRVNGSAEDGMWRRQIDKLRNCTISNLRTVADLMLRTLGSEEWRTVYNLSLYSPPAVPYTCTSRAEVKGCGDRMAANTYRPRHGVNDG